jgi:hypothetical protein
MPLLFVYINQPACARARKILKMTSNQSFFLDVNSVGEYQLCYRPIGERVRGYSGW